MNRGRAIRPPAIAGTFYPGDNLKLAGAVDELLKAAYNLEKAAVGNAPAPKAIIVPHAGFKYSGAIAARAYARLVPIASQIRRVVLFGPAHRVAIRGLAVPEVEMFETPLGRVPLDREYIDILKSQPYTEVSDAAHAEEHCLEVQLPFLQKTLGKFQLTPVVVGGASAEKVADALRRVWGGEETLIVISSDLSHYHPYEEAQRRDSDASAMIMSLASDRLRSQDACGWRSVSGLIRRAIELELIPTILDIRNSGDTAGPQDRVVGYGAWAFCRDPDTTEMPLSDKHRQELLRISAATVQRAAGGKPYPKVAVGTFDVALQRPGASFVTLTRNGRLRGCMGSLQAYRPLVVDVAERGYASTIKDPRFKPVTTAELPGMHLEVAVLTATRPMRFLSEIDLIEQLRPGIDGIIIQDKGKRATFLPKVWDDISKPALFLARLKQKAGLERGHWSDTFRAWRYETVRFAATFR